MKANDGRKVSHRKGVAIGHSKTVRRSKKLPGSFTMEQLRRDVERGCRYFWSRPHRRGQRPEGVA